MKKTVGIIGYGNMGSVIANCVKNDCVVLVYDSDSQKYEKCEGIEPALDLGDLLDSSQVLILAVKPQDSDSLLHKVKDKVSGKLIISIAAGISTWHIESILASARVIRAMPNLPARVSKGVTCLSKGRFASEEDLIIAEGIFAHLGRILRIEEILMNAATAISGSGPGFYFDLMLASKIDFNDPDKVEQFMRDIFIPEFTLAARKVGFAENEARLLAQSTAEGSRELLIKSSLDPAELAKQVTSKGGTTEAGIAVLHKGGSLQDAALAALERAKELSRKG